MKWNAPRSDWRLPRNGNSEEQSSEVSVPRYMMLYIHIPFCRKKCDYCDFLSFAGRESEWEKYKDDLIKEMSAVSLVDNISSVYIGGGTPTVLPPSYLREILVQVQRFNILPDAEITCESNPETITEEVLAALKEGGVNRLSIGLQSTHPHLLRNIGRGGFSEVSQNNGFVGDAALGVPRHTSNPRDAEGGVPYEKKIALAGEYFSNISIDLMFSLPGQTLADWRQTLQTAVELAPNHISAYALTIEEATPLGQRLRNVGDDELDRRMYHYAREFLERHGYKQYEISNFARPGCESRHNIGYWTRQEYLGFGLGAHSFRGDVRYSDTETTNLTQEEAQAEFFILGLRLTKGVNLKNYKAEYGELPQRYADWIKKTQQDGLLELSGENLRLTHKGMDIANYVMGGFL